MVCRPFLFHEGVSMDDSRWCLPCMHLPAATEWLRAPKRSVVARAFVCATEIQRRVEFSEYHDPGLAFACRIANQVGAYDRRSSRDVYRDGGDASRLALPCPPV